MITIISGTNRKGSRTLQVAQYYLNTLKPQLPDTRLLSLEDIRPFDRGETLLKVEKELLIPSEKFIIIMPEYNGSFPGILKALFDNTDIKKCWWFKKVLLVGLADGRGGNLRGLEHMTSILHYLKMNVHYNKLPLSKINNELNAEGQFFNAGTAKAIAEQINDFVAY
jgi:NAD(P)H-dependent FMN reductase